MYLIFICNAILHVYLSYLLYVIIMYIIYVCNAVLYYLYYMPAPYSVTALHNDYCIQSICILCLHPIQSRRCIMVIALQPLAARDQPAATCLQCTRQRPCSGPAIANSFWRSRCAVPVSPPAPLAWVLESGNGAILCRSD